MTDRKDAQKYAAQNRKARFEFAVEEKIEAGLALTGTEVKALRAGLVNISESYAGPAQGDLYLFNSNISEYTRAGAHLQHEPRRARKLLLHKKQRDRLIGAVQRDGITLIPLSIYFNARGIAKLELGVAKGRKKEDKRAVIKEREWKREQGRLLRGKE
jgi:SsrA-binding protein